jgi:hypothetical protein
VQRTRSGKSFDGSDFRAILAAGECEAAIDAFTIYQHGASAALAVITSLFRAG